VESTAQAGTISKTAIWTGRIISGLLVLLLTVDGVMKLVKPAAVVQGSAQLQIPLNLAAGIGIALLICTALYAIPRTSILGAILLTGYLGGATMAQLRIGLPFFSQVLAPVYFGVLVWGGIYLQNERVRALIPRLR
jgi:hypothetical protein